MILKPTAKANSMRGATLTPPPPNNTYTHTHTPPHINTIQKTIPASTPLPLSGWQRSPQPLCDKPDQWRKPRSSAPTGCRHRVHAATMEKWSCSPPALQMCLQFDQRHSMLITSSSYLYEQTSTMLNPPDVSAVWPKAFHVNYFIFILVRTNKHNA